MPFVSDRTRAMLANEYVPAADYKAFALNINGVTAFVVGQPSEEAAKTAALEQCQKRADTGQSPRKCELYAVGNTVVYPHGKPPMPPLPWIRHDPSTERPFVGQGHAADARRTAKRGSKTSIRPAARRKAIALGPGGAVLLQLRAPKPSRKSARRILESCGAVAGVALHDRGARTMSSSCRCRPP